jgi:serine/threonine protein kinase
MATVLLAEDERLHRPVALKRMHPAIGAEVAVRFDREAKLGASLDHPCFVKVYDVLAEDEQVTIVMEYVEGPTLDEIIQQQGRLGPARALAILRPLADALDHAHSQGVIHRDLKPANVLVRNDGVVKLADLGIATAADTTRITTSGTQLGSAPYMAPEQLEGKEPSARTDVWGLATVAFEMLAGRRARTATTPLGVVHQVANEPPPDLREACPEVGVEAAEALKQGMAFDASDRPHSAGELVDRLERALTAEPEELALPRPPANRKNTPKAEVAHEKAQPGARTSAEATPRAARSRRGAALMALAVALAAIAAVVILAPAVEQDKPDPDRPRDVPRVEAPTPRRESPAQAVRDFYERAAADDYDGAWRLAGPGVRSQLGGFGSFRGTFDTLQSVEFEEARVIERSADRATVTLATSARHTDRTDHCRGEVELTGRNGADWRLERLSIDCS